MFHEGARSVGGDLDSVVVGKIYSLLTQFCEITAQAMAKQKLRRAMVRSMLPCNLIIILDATKLWIAAGKALGIPTTLHFDRRAENYPVEEIFTAARWEFGIDEPFVISFPEELLESSPATRAKTIEAISQSHVQAEINRVNAQMNIIQINPIFGPASYGLDPRLAFVLMPFTDELTQIYQSFIKPVVESPEFGLVCKRADDIKSNKAIIQDIWKSLCEARFVIVDLTGFNANVLYELGIAHTLGKETILIYQRGEEVKFPFDLTHIRRIEYQNNAIGGVALAKELRETLMAVISAAVKA